jgi:LmbE family N-acetylglucosaminyl deacetylase
MTDERFTLVSFHAHPDDESILTGGTLAKAAADGHRVVLVTATDGERGLAAAVDGRGSALADRRGGELEAAARALGCARVVRFGFGDSGLRVDPEDRAAFANLDVEEVAARLAAVLVEERADVLTVYDPRGGYGHPDHIQVHRAGTRAAALAGTPVVLEATLDGDLVARLLRVLTLLRSPLRRAAPLGGRDIYTPRRLLTHRIDVTPQLGAKRSAMAAHASQRQSDGQARMLARFLALPIHVFGLVCGREWFVEQGREATPKPQADVFASLRQRSPQHSTARADVAAEAPETRSGSHAAHLP